MQDFCSCSCSGTVFVVFRHLKALVHGTFSSSRFTGYTQSKCFSGLDRLNLRCNCCVNLCYTMLHLRILAAQMQIKTVQFLETQLFLGQSQVVLTCQRPCSLITLTQGLKAKVSKGPDIQRQYNLYMSCKPHRNLYNNPPLQRVKSLIGQTRIYANHTYITRHNVPPAAALAKVLGINLT